MRWDVINTCRAERKTRRDGIKILEDVIKILEDVINTRWDGIK